MSAMEVDSPSPPPPSARSGSFSANAGTTTKPKGILKTPSHEGTAPRNLQWNEENLAINELSKDSTMKISEPKTPYVRYNAETDTVLDLDKIPGFELGRADLDGASSSDGAPLSPTRSNSGLSSSASGGGSNPNSRRGSEASEKMVKVDAPGPSSGEEDDEDELADEETIEHRKQFRQARKGHYANEAQAMLAAQKLIDDEEEASSGPDSTTPLRPPPPAMPSMTTTARANGV